MSDEKFDLCCCEYYDVADERNHILACCCNCVDLDEAFDSLVRGQTVSNQNKTGLMTTLQDRLRIPWRGGAKQIAFDAILPVIILPIMFLIASMSLWWTIFSFTTVTIFLVVIFNFLIRTIPRTKFFFIWTMTSMVLLYFIFEFVVIPFLEILVEENIALSILIFGFVMCMYLMKVRMRQLHELEGNEAEIGNSGRDVNKLSNCFICDTRIPEKDHHCVWFDCCIGKHNQCLFILCLFFGIASLLYSSNLTLTSVCHPFIFYKTILLPDDCSDVYLQFELGLSFVAAVYSLFISILLLILFLQQLLLVSVGMSMKDWRKLPFSSKLCLGMTSHRPASRGFHRNWSKIICWTRNHYSLLNQS